MSHLVARLLAPRDGLPLAVFRLAFGLVLCLGVVRFAAYGWIDELYVEPVFHFRYYGFSWLKPLPAAGMYAVFAGLFLAALALAAGFFYRTAAAVFFVLFTYVELLDQAYYLNHYYLVSLLVFLLLWLPAQRYFSFDYRARLSVPVAAWCLLVPRVQVALVYFYAGVAKLNVDWLLAARPLRGWLATQAGLPLVGPWLALPETAYLASWFGAAFDLSAPFLFFWRRTRAWAYGAAVLFHLATAALFNIGLFPWLMLAGGLLFFDGDQYRRLMQQLGLALRPAAAGTAAPTPAPVLALMAVFVALQVLLPLRHWLYPGDPRWTEEGLRYAWRVMAVEKTGSAVFWVQEPGSGRRWRVDPDRWLSPEQEGQMVVQPDLILRFAHFLAKEYRRQGHPDVEVRAEVFVSLNGRPARRLVDPEHDLAREEDGLLPKDWILP